MSARRVKAVVRKELREYRRNGAIIATAAILPIVILIQPLIAILVVRSNASKVLGHEQPLLYLLAIPAIIPATLASYAVVGERQQGTLEPILTTPIRNSEFLLAKALAAFLPSVVIAYGVYAIFVGVVELFAHPGVAAAVIRGPELASQLVFTPLLAGLSVWIGVAVSTRTTDVRTAQQLATLGSLPTMAVTTLIAYKVIHATPQLAVGLAAALIVADRLGWRAASAAFHRERLITNTK